MAVVALMNRKDQTFTGDKNATVDTPLTFFAFDLSCGKAMSERHLTSEGIVEKSIGLRGSRPLLGGPGGAEEMVAAVTKQGVEGIVGEATGQPR